MKVELYVYGVIMSERLVAITDKLRDMSMKWVLRGLDPSFVGKVEDFMDRGEGLYSASRNCVFKHAFEEYVALNSLYQSVLLDVSKAQIEGSITYEEAKKYMNVLKEAYETYKDLAIKNFKWNCGCQIRF